MSDSQSAFMVEALIQLRVVRIFLHTLKRTDVSKSLNECKSGSSIYPSNDIQVSLSDEQDTDVLTIQSHKNILHIPLPKNLIVDRQNLGILQRPDHLEIKLRLVAFSNEILEGHSESTEAKTQQEVACRHCQKGLVGKTLERFLPMPSNDWEESADNWFDIQCGCGGPAKAAVLAKKVRARLVPTRGICLVGSTSYLLHEGDLLLSSILDTVRNSSEGPQSTTFEEQETHRKNPVLKEDSEEAVGRSPREEDNVADTGGTAAETFHSSQRTPGADTFTKREDSLVLSRPGARVESHGPHAQNGASCASDFVPSKDSRHSSGKERMGAGSGTASQVCCAESEATIEPGCAWELEARPVEPTEPLSHGHHWIPVSCPGCKNSIGVRRSNGSLSIEGPPGVYLLKHHVVLSDKSSSPDHLVSPHKALLSHFVARLQEASERRVCSRFLIRGLLTGRPFCHVTVLSRETFVWTGKVGEGGDIRERSHGLKVLFSKCEAGESAGRNGQKDCESVFLLDEDAEMVLQALKTNSSSYPSSCRTLNGMSLSFL